jgi:hypothetical protein
MTQSPGSPGGGQSGPAPGGPPRAPAADLPELPPPPGLSFVSKLAIGFGTLVLGGYAAVALTGWQPAQPRRDELPASVRGSPGGYRSYHFWHSGYHGGK